LLRLRPDVVEFSTPKAGLLGMIAARLAGVNCRVYLLRGLRFETATGLKKLAMIAAERLTSYCAQVVLCSSQSLRQQALALRLAPDFKLQLLGTGSSHGVDTDRFAPGPSNLRWRLGIPDRVPVIGYVGRLTRDKGIPELLQGFSKVLQQAPETRLLMVGWFDESEDALDASIRRQILEHPRIVHTGFVEDTAPYYRAMDFLILPSKREGFPNVVLEAAATGIPVITTFATGSRNAVVAGVTGLLIPKGSVAAICAACMELICDWERRMRMGREARAWVLEYFQERDILGLTVAFYRNLLQADPTDVWQTEHSEVAI
jgi:glycosyltransferase involved in cell wall biosynthesis